MARHHHSTDPARSRRAIAWLLSLAILAAVLAAGTGARAADDIDLLRDRGGTPFVMILLDTSASMNTTPPQTNRSSDLGSWAPGNADDPQSKLFQVKRALYEVFSQVENVHFGFAGFNQDHLEIRAKHWIYKATAPAVFFAAPIEITYPASDEVWTFGAHLSLPTGTPGVAGSCAAPLDYSTDRAKLDRFARLGVTGLATTTLWVGNKGTTYRVTLQRSANPTVTDPVDPTVTVANALGSNLLETDVTADVVTSCSPLVIGSTQSASVVFRKISDFLMVEADVGANGQEAPIGSEIIDTSNCTADEYIAGFWNYQDVIANGTCGGNSTRPFTGRGWDSNQDIDVDPFCSGGNCYNLRFPTTVHGKFSPDLDYGDVIPLDWSVEYREEFLKRLNPRHPNYLPQSQWDGDPTNGEAPPEAFTQYFGEANFFDDRPDPTLGVLQLKNEDERPLVAYGNSPLGRAINDFRCWVLGDGNKCRPQDVSTGWNQLFAANDLWYHCRVPYLIVISDGEDNSVGENPTSDASDFNQRAGVRTFAFTFRKTAQLQSMANSGGGELILIANGDQLKDELRRILGQIQQEARTFATAAVPSVQAATEQNIYVTHFTPLNDTAVWEGHMRSFPSVAGIDLLNDTPNWDAADELLVQAPTRDPSIDPALLDLKLGNNPDQRRVFYAKQRIPGSVSLGAWGANRRLFDRTDVEPGPTTASEAEKDLWDGLNLNFDPTSPTSVRETRAQAHRIIEQTLVEKTWDDPVRGTVSYVLGEIFHSDPLIVGAPTNIRYFVQDAEETFDGNGNPLGTGYRDFFSKHEFRRKLLLAGANDGLFHAFDAGKASLVSFTDELGIDRTDVKFDDGSGREVFSYIPRTVLPTVATMAENPFAHRWSVDGTVAVGDAFIDPLHSGTPTVSDRNWRTIVVGGLREGGDGYFALDITQPDVLRQDQIGPLDAAGTQRDVVLPTDQEIVPDCIDVTGDGVLGCDDQVTYPTPLWEFTDSVWDSVTREFVRLDEDANGRPDLGETWSSPDIGRMRVVENGAVVNKYVAVFGGGLDPSKADTEGNWLYIVDIETGQTIYKRRVDGSAPSAPAAVDTDQDSFFDTIYIGTTKGFMYRLDLQKSTSTGTTYPRLTSQLVRGVNGITYQVTRIEKQSDDVRLWDPQAIFSTEGRPIYFPPAVLFVGDLGKFALAFGTGDREDLTSISTAIGRFYLFVDESAEIPAADLPMVETRFTEVTVNEADNPNLLSDPNIPVGQRGWYLVLAENERLIGAPFGFAGITFFATFTANDPRTDPLTCDITDSNCTNPNCRLTGVSRIYLVGTTDADAFLDVNGVLQRYHEIQGFVTNPFTEQAVNLTAASGSGTPDPTQPPPPPFTDSELKLMEKLKANFPEDCKFGNHRIDVKVISSDQVKVERIAPVPICIIESNWKEVTE